MVEIEPLLGLSTDEYSSTIDGITAAGDFRYSPRRGRSDLIPGKPNVHKPHVSEDDEVVLSPVTHVHLLEEEGKSVSEISAELGLPTETVLTDISIAAAISHTAEPALDLEEAGAA